ncbi:hypothetical protein JCM11491_002272 [Sporobolomyces phaffii]
MQLATSPRVHSRLVRSTSDPTFDLDPSTNCLSSSRSHQIVPPPPPSPRPAFVRSHLVRAHTSLELGRSSRTTTSKLEPSAANRRGRDPDDDDDDEHENAWRGFAADLGRLDQNRTPKTTTEDANTKHPSRERPRDSIEDLILPALLGGKPDQDLSGGTGDGDEDEDDSTRWSPEAFTREMVARGAGGGPRRRSSYPTTGTRRRVTYDVPDVGESWDATNVAMSKVMNDVAVASPEVTSKGRAWSFDKLLASNAKRAEGEKEKEEASRSGRTRALERLKLVETQLAWSV